MKNFVSKLFLICSLFIIVNVSLFAEDAVVTSLKGKVEVSHGGDSWLPLAVGDKLSESDVVSTGFQSEVRIKYNGSVMLLGALTRVTLNQMASSATTDKVDVFLNTGAVRSKVTHTDDRKVSYNVRGPVAVASVRGTDFTCFANGNVQCFEGAVAVYSTRSFNAMMEAATATEEESEEAEEESAVQTSEQAVETSVESATESAESTSTPETETAVASTVNDNAPADNQVAAAPETPASVGPAKATTPANEISSTAPAGAVVVAQNQSTTVSSTGKTANPLEVSINNISSAKNKVSNSASKEAVSVGVTTETTKTVEQPVRKGSVQVKVELE